MANRLGSSSGRRSMPSSASLKFPLNALEKNGDRLQMRSRGSSNDFSRGPAKKITFGPLMISLNNVGLASSIMTFFEDIVLQFFGYAFFWGSHLNARHTVYGAWSSEHSI